MQFANASWIVVLLGSAASGCVLEDVGEEAATEQIEQAIANGTVDPNSRQVVELLFPTGPCSGTLITRWTVLTAAHCLPAQGAQVTVTGEDLQWKPELGAWDWGTYTVTGTAVMASGTDVALVNLPNPVGLGVTISQVATWVTPGMPISIVGFGETSPGVRNWHVRRRAPNTIDRVDATNFYFDGTSGVEGATCFGDSGGPAYREWSDCVVGITHGQASPPFCSEAGGEFIDTRVDTRFSWIQANAIGSVIPCFP